MKFYVAVFSLLALSLAYLSPVHAQDAGSKALTQADVEAIVKKVINENPQLIMDSVQAYQMKKQADANAQASKIAEKLQKDLKNDTTSPSAGNPTANVTIVEFFDYHCGYCKQFLPTVTELLKQDRNLRVVFKDFPILSDDSTLAAKAAAAVNSIDKNKYLAYHIALMGMSGKFTVDNLTDKAKEIGIDEKTFKTAMQSPEIEKQITSSKELAYSLNIHGTPAIIIGTEIVPGAISADEMKAKIAAARKKG